MACKHYNDNKGNRNDSHKDDRKDSHKGDCKDSHKGDREGRPYKDYDERFAQEPYLCTGDPRGCPIRISLRFRISLRSPFPILNSSQE